jgi:hypothetical protein
LRLIVGLAMACSMCRRQIFRCSDRDHLISSTRQYICACGQATACMSQAELDVEVLSSAQIPFNHRQLDEHHGALARTIQFDHSRLQPRPITDPPLLGADSPIVEITTSAARLRTTSSHTLICTHVRRIQIQHAQQQRVCDRSAARRSVLDDCRCASASRTRRLYSRLGRIRVLRGSTDVSGQLDAVLPDQQRCFGSSMLCTSPSHISSHSSRWSLAMFDTH